MPHDWLLSLDLAAWNAARGVALPHAAGVRRIVLVTDGWHLPRSRQAFEQAARRQGAGLAIVPVPMGLGEGDLRGVLRWLPSVAGCRLPAHVDGAARVARPAGRRLKLRPRRLP